jgi:hypothetical protein
MTKQEQNRRERDKQLDEVIQDVIDRWSHQRAIGNKFTYSDLKLMLKHGITSNFRVTRYEK